MEKRVIQFSPPDIGEEEIKAVAEVLRSGWITTGPKTKEFEAKLHSYIFEEELDSNTDSNKRVVCLNSATAAEELILRILGIGEGDQVIVPAYTYTATASAAIHVGAEVVFIDSQPDSFEMDYDAVEKAITSKTKAIIPVDLGGVVCDYKRIYEAVNNTKDKFEPKKNESLGGRIQQSLGRIAVVADCAHALGAKRKINDEWKNAGEIADFSSFSFHAVKNLTTAEGGAAAWKHIDGIDDQEIYQLFQLMSLHGQNKDALAKTKKGSWEYDIVEPYYKCNMTDIMAAIGLVQLERYSELLERRKTIINRYDRALDSAGVWHVNHYTESVVSSGHLYQTRVPNINEEDRNAIITNMAEQGIVCNVHYKPLPMMSAYQKKSYSIKNYPNAYKLYENLITLPLHTLLIDIDVEYIIKCYERIIDDI